MTANFVDQFGFNDEEFSEHDENIKWVAKDFSTQELSFFIHSQLHYLIFLIVILGCVETFFLFSVLSATFDRIAEINFNLDADDNSVSVFHASVSHPVN